MLAGHQVLVRLGRALITRQLAAARITHLLRLTAHIRMLFTIAHKTWLLPFVCAATTEAQAMAHQCLPTRRSAVDCMVMLKSHRTERFTFLIIAVAALARSSFQKITA